MKTTTKRQSGILPPTTRDALYSGLLKLDAFAALLNQMAMMQEEKTDEPSSKVYWSLYYTAEAIHGELLAAHQRGGAS